MAISLNDNKLMVAAIDFGTTFSGYAFSMRHDLEKDPPTNGIFAANWHSSSGGLISFKTPTTVLLNAEKKLEAFGFEAEEKYAELAEEEEHEEYYYFRRFKMMLYDKLRKERLTTKTTISDIRNKQLPAVEVFTHSIRYLKQHLLDSLKDKGSLVHMDDIIWVLTVPAIWDDPAKQFMRKAAEAAGINGLQLMIALEPEAASIYCKHLPVEKLEGDGDKISVFKPGSKYLVLDAGGGTIDITVHEVTQDGNLKELDRASGNDWGGTSVDNAFKKTLSEIVGESMLEGYCHKYTGDYIEMFRDFEIKKRKRVDPKDSNPRITLKIPASFIEECEESKIKKATQKSKYSKDFAWGSDKLRINLPAFEKFFEPACIGTINHVKELLQSPKVKGTNIILMVGGFSESPLLQDAVRKAFPFCRIIIPQEAGLAVLRGAVLFGHNPKIIHSRVAKYTYGVSTNRKFDPKNHKQSKIKDYDGVPYCTDLFSCHVKKGQTLTIDEAQKEKNYFPMRADQKGMDISIYTSPDENPSYVDDFGCLHIGDLGVDMKDTTGGLDREIKVRLIFGDTELKVEAMNERTKEKTHAEFDLLKVVKD